VIFQFHRRFFGFRACLSLVVWKLFRVIVFPLGRRSSGFLWFFAGGLCVLEPVLSVVVGVLALGASPLGLFLLGL